MFCFRVREMHCSQVARDTWLLSRKWPECHEIETWLPHPMTGKLSLSTQQ